MKLNFQNNGRDAALRRPVGTARRPYQQGIALVITLILLSVTAFMTIIFLIMSQRERGAVSVAANQTTARFAAETAVQRATAQMLAPVIGLNDPNAYDLSVSTNYINPGGFTNGIVSPVNVNYDHTSLGAPLTLAQQQQNLLNLLYDPRPPVFITNKLTGGTDFRYYLDLNRNGRYDTNGLQPEINNLGSASGFTNNFVGDPEWIGVLERPELPHSSSNRFIARYAYIALPAGKTLDLNYIHNYAKRLNQNLSPVTGDGFFRNQGVGSWEINLAAFLTDLNTNFWNVPTAPYNYATDAAGLPNYGNASSGRSFDDALSVLRYRYNTNYTTLAAANTLSNNPFAVDAIDEYADGPLMTGTVALTNDNDNTALSWSGSDNTNHFFSDQDLFDPTKVRINVPNGVDGLPERLIQAGKNNSSYDRYTFYRLLAQLGTDTAPEQGKLNLNYRNVTDGVIVPNLETNYYAWSPVEFFTNVFQRLFTNSYGCDANFFDFSTNTDGSVVATNMHLPLYPNNYYTPNLHRLLQLAANLYDATKTNNPADFFTAGTNLYQFPSVFRPVFGRLGSNVWIASYTNVINADEIINTNSATGNSIRDVNDGDPTSSMCIMRVNPLDNVYGVPVIIGARKGFPNFNEFAMQNAVVVTRKLEFYDPTPTSIESTVAATNQLYAVVVSNTFGIEAWNSYTNKYPRNLEVIAVVDLKISMTNAGYVWATNHTLKVVTNVMATPVGWRGSPANVQSSVSTPSFLLPLFTNVTLLQTQYVCIQPGSRSPASFQSQSGKYALLPPSTGQLGKYYPAFQSYLDLKTRVRYILVDTSSTTNRIVDYVSLSWVQPTLDVAAELATDTNNVNSFGSLWIDPANAKDESAGVLNQIREGENARAYQNSLNYDPNDPTNELRSAEFQYRLTHRVFGTGYTGKEFSLTNAFESPFNPTRIVYQDLIWRANDPLVHYTVPDLEAGNLIAGKGTNLVFPSASMTAPTDKNDPLDNLGGKNPVNPNYQPWGNGQVGPTDSGKKDPLVTRSDDWDFPTNKLPNVGWVGRVHRGTPWQTIYLKSDVVDITNWMTWTGNTLTNLLVSNTTTNPLVGNRRINDAQLAQPTNDWSLFDLFTAAPNANATRGQLSVNQTNLAAWSAVLSGVIALDMNKNPAVIQPAALSSEVKTIVDSINGTRTANFNGSFKHLGDVLSTPALTVISPYLGGSSAVTNIANSTTMNDEVVERLPQQILGLLRGPENSTRFVVYAYGQSLAPADHSILSSGLCTNYQITGETAVRAVIRVDGPTQKPHTVVESFNYLSPND